MSSISGVSSTLNPYQTTIQNGVNQFLTDFNAIGGALQSGDISSAQSALATFQQNLPDNSQTLGNQPFGGNSQANTDYQSLVSALKSGDAPGAQNAFANLQTDLKAAHKGHHHHGSSVTPTPAPADTTTAGSTVDSDGDNDGSGLNVTA